MVKGEKTHAKGRGPGFAKCFNRYDEKTPGTFKFTGMAIIAPEVVTSGCSGLGMKTDPYSFCGMPGGRTATSAETPQPFANNPSEVCPNGKGDETVVRNGWSRDSSKH